MHRPLGRAVRDWGSECSNPFIALLVLDALNYLCSTSVSCRDRSGRSAAIEIEVGTKMPRKDSRFISRKAFTTLRKISRPHTHTHKPFQSLVSSRPVLSSPIRASRKEGVLQSPQVRQICGHFESKDCGWNVLLMQCEGSGKKGRAVFSRTLENWFYSSFSGTGLNARPSFIIRAPYNHFIFTNESAET